MAQQREESATNSTNPETTPDRRRPPGFFQNRRCLEPDRRRSNGPVGVAATLDFFQVQKGRGHSHPGHDGTDLVHPGDLQGAANSAA